MRRTVGKACHSIDTRVGEQSLRYPRVLLVVEPARSRLAFPIRKPDINCGKKAAAVFAEGGGELGLVGGGADGVVGELDGLAIVVVARLACEDRNYAAFAVEDWPGGC